MENNYYFVVMRCRNKYTDSYADSGTVYEFPKHMSPKDVFFKVEEDMLERGSKYPDTNFSIVAFNRV